MAAPQFDSLTAVDNMIQALLNDSPSEWAADYNQRRQAAARDRDRVGEHVIDPLSPAADLLDEAMTVLTQDGMARRHGPVATGGSEAAVAVEGPAGRQFVLVCIPVPDAMVNRATLHPGLLARIHADVELELAVGSAPREK
jgi:hypothetical protein